MTTHAAPVRKTSRQALGALGERLAAQHLEASGYRILIRNYRKREGEIDIVASQDGTTAFVEVKSRRGDHMGTAREAITQAKAERMIALAQTYAAEHDLDDNVRIDVIAIDFTPAGRLISLHHIESAVMAD